LPFIVIDTLTDDAIGPFEEEEQAIQFVMEASDVLNDSGQTFSIYQTTDVTEWLLNNTATNIKEEV
jgi:hypothetical protein